MKNCFLGFILFCKIVLGQTSITGLVVDQESNQFIENTNVFVEGFPFGTKTDSEGYFSLIIPDSLFKSNQHALLLIHVAYDSLRIQLNDAKTIKIYKLSPIVFSSDDILVKGQKKTIAEKEMPVAIKIIEADLIENKGFIDIGDLIRTDQSIQIDEQINGVKNVSLRAGNADDVLILYNGIKLNNNYTNTFDLSLINPEDIQRIEVIKGSNTALFGGEAFSGLINIIPKLDQDHKIRFMQKIGSFNSGDWNLNLNHNFHDNLYLSYTQRRNGSERKYASGGGLLKNLSVNHTANLSYSLPKSRKEADNTLNLFYMNSTNDYSNNRLFETSNDFNDLVSLRYNGDILYFENIELIGSYQRLENEIAYSTDISATGRDINNKKVTLTTRKGFKFKPFNFLVSYQLDVIKLQLQDNREFLTDQNISSDIQIERKSHGIVGLVTFESEKEELSDNFNIALSYRLDKIEDDIQPGNSLKQNNQWDDQSIKISFNSARRMGDVDLTITASGGTNVKYPTLFNQLSTPQIFNDNEPYVTTRLQPEKIRSQEIGFKLQHDKLHTKNIKSIGINGSYFQNFYKNKFRNYYTPYNAFSLYDNIKTAEIKGLEMNTEIVSADNVFIVDSGFSLYEISDRAAFPLKSDSKISVAATYQKNGYNLQINYFNFGERTAWFRDFSNVLVEQVLPSSSNINLHAAKALSIYDFRLTLSVNAMNIFNDGTELNGLAINDRRIYMGVEIKY